MSSDLSIACSLDASRAAVRLSEMAALGRDGLLESEVDGASARLLFTADVRARLEDVVAAERDCCGFLAFRWEAHDDGLALIVDAPDEALPALHEWVRVFTAAR